MNSARDEGRHACLSPLVSSRRMSPLRLASTPAGPRRVSVQHANRKDVTPSCAPRVRASDWRYDTSIVVNDVVSQAENAWPAASVRAVAQAAVRTAAGAVAGAVAGAATIHTTRSHPRHSRRSQHARRSRRRAAPTATCPHPHPPSRVRRSTRSRCGSDGDRRLLGRSTERGTGAMDRCVHIDAVVPGADVLALPNALRRRSDDERRMTGSSLPHAVVPNRSHPPKGHVS